MKKKKIIPIILLSLLVGTNMIGCKKTTTSQSETQYYSLDVYGNKIYFDESYEEISGVKELTELSLNYSINVDYTNGEYLKALDLYTDDIKVIDQETDYAGYMKEVIEERQLVRTLVSYEITDIEFYTAGGIQEAIVTLDYISSVQNDTPERLEALNMELNKNYKTNLSSKYRKQPDGWRLVEDLSIGDKEEVS